jgi:hypothetical protein
VTTSYITPSYITACWNNFACASSFTPKSLSSSLSGTGEHGVEKIFAPGQEAQASDSSASSFAPGHEKP